MVFEGANTRAITAYTWLHLLLAQASKHQTMAAAGSGLASADCAKSIRGVWRCVRLIPGRPSMQAVPGWDLPPPSTAGVWLQLSNGWTAFEACRWDGNWAPSSQVWLGAPAPAVFVVACWQQG